jgi:hypothetical protein
VKRSLPLQGHAEGDAGSQFPRLNTAVLLREGEAEEAKLRHLPHDFIRNAVFPLDLVFQRLQAGVHVVTHRPPEQFKSAGAG